MCGRCADARRCSATAPRVQGCGLVGRGLPWARRAATCASSACSSWQAGQASRWVRSGPTSSGSSTPRTYTPSSSRNEAQPEAGRGAGTARCPCWRTTITSSRCADWPPPTMTTNRLVQGDAEPATVLQRSAAGTGESFEVGNVASASGVPPIAGPGQLAGSEAGTGTPWRTRIRPPASRRHRHLAPGRQDRDLPRRQRGCPDRPADVPAELLLISHGGAGRPSRLVG
jgi:hypothetical protein